MPDVGLTDLGIVLGLDLAASGTPSRDQDKAFFFIDLAQALVAGASSPGTPDAVAKYIVLAVAARAWRQSLDPSNPEYQSESRTVGGVTEAYTRFQGASGASSVFLTSDEIAALRGANSSSRARSVGLSGVTFGSAFFGEV